MICQDLCFWKDYQWLLLLKENKHREAQTLLKSKDISEIKRMINGHFVAPEESRTDPGKDCVDASFPWCIAAIHGSNDMLELLYTYGVDVTVTEDENNVFHLLAERSSLDRELQDNLLTTYETISELIGNEEMVTLLKQKNSHGLTPLQWCLFHNAYGLYNLILNTPGVYKVDEEHRGGIVRRWYDVTEFENQIYKNTISHILYGTCFVLKQNTESAATRNLFKSKFVQTYMDTKVKVNYLTLAAWFLVRFLYGTCALMYLSCGELVMYEQLINRGNSNITAQLQCTSWIISANITKKIMNFYVILIALSLLVISLLIDLVEITASFYRISKKKLYIDMLSKDYALQHNSHKFIYFLNKWLFALLIINDLLQFGHGSAIFPEPWRQIIFLVLGIGSSVGLAQFMILSKQVGWILVILQRLQVDLVAFTVIFILFVPPLSVMNSVLSQMYPNMTSEFDSFWSSAYFTFMSYLGQKDFAEFEPHKHGLIAFYQMFMTLAALLIVNFIIAVFANSVSHIMNNIEVLGTIQKLSFIFMAEQGFTNIPGLRRLHAKMVRRNFENIDGKLCLRTVSPR